jgi:maltose alpha-D-glucosyltransferase / alpha-amylase
MPRFNIQSEPDPLWFKDAVIYEVHVRAFSDASGDGMGDFAGLTQKLDYLRDLGVTAIWVLPFCPSPWRDDGYDISDYENIHPAYGTLKDFQTFLREAHGRGLRVISELVLNHTSDHHAWFQRSRRAAPGSRWREYYVWSDTPERYRDARIIFRDFETSNWTWDPIAHAYYWHRFYAHQPDLNYENPEVRQVMLDAVDFWLNLGVDGLRLDAVPYLYEREGTNCENLPETHAYLKRIRAHIDSKYRDRLILAEANQWPEDAIAYFGAGDECHMAFHFPIMPRLFMATRMEDRHPITDIMDVTPAIPDSCQWALFLRNHDELTLEMVTDEERDYMYRVYAQDRNMRINLGIRRRLAPLLENDRRRIELLNALLFSLPGTPVIYYGDEIGMGDNIYLGDRNGVRTPMQWSAGRNAGFSHANPQRLYLPAIIDPEYHYEAVNVEAQHNNPHSLLWWMKRILAQRRQLRSMGRGSIEFLAPENRRVLAFIRRYEDEQVLVVANLSRFAQATEIDLACFQGTTPIEVFGRSPFPPVTDRPYFLSLGPHAFYWFLMQPKEAPHERFTIRTGAPPTFIVDDWDDIFSIRTRVAMERLLPALLRSRRWFRGKDRVIRLVETADVIAFPKSHSYLILVRVEYGQGDPEMYTIPITVAMDAEAEHTLESHSELARLDGPEGRHGVLYSGLLGTAFGEELLGAMVRRRHLAGDAGELSAGHLRNFRALWGEHRPALAPTPARTDRENTIVFFGDRFALKLYRKLEEGPHPERELLELLNAAGFAHVPPLAGAITYQASGGEPMTVALLEGFVREGTGASHFTMDHIGLFYEQALALEPDGPRTEAPGVLIGSYMEFVRLLALCTGEMHVALASRPEEPAVAPEPFTDFYRHGLYHGLLTHMSRTVEELHKALRHLPEAVRTWAQSLLDRQDQLRLHLQPLRDTRLDAMRIRAHGDYHLGQVLYTGRDLVILDFEGDPARPLSERRIKRSPLVDAASMLDSFHHAAYSALHGNVPGIVPKPESAAALEKWAKFWYQGVSAAFLEAYLAVPGLAALLPSAAAEQHMLLNIYRMDTALQKLSRLLVTAPGHIHVPIRAAIEILDGK